MAFNGSGVFVRLYNWVNDAAASIKIRADRMDAEMDGMATGLSNCITKDGQTTITANLPMATYRHTGVGAAVNRTDYARTDQVQDGKLNWVDGGGTADAITASYTIPLTTLVDGQFCLVRATAANATTTPTFSPSGLTARTIVKNGGQALAAGDIRGDGHELILRYDLANTRWELINPATPVIPDNSITFAKLDADIIDDATEAVITASDNILFGDVTDSGNTKRDTVQGILDLFTGTFVGLQVLTSDGTYTATSGATNGIAIAIGGGGGGGGVAPASGGSEVAAGGGGAGGTAIARFAISGTVSYTIGAAGTAGNSSGGNGGAGGTTTFTGIAVAAGGSGGTGSGASAADETSAPGGAGGAGSTGAILLSGGDGANGLSGNDSASGGNGGSASFGGGGGRGGHGALGGGTQTACLAGKNYGGGGGGAGVTAGTGTAGAAGAPGVIYVFEFK